MAVSHSHRHLVVRNGNFILLLTSSDQEWQFTLLLTSSGRKWQLADIPLHLLADLLPPQVHQGIYVMGCIWQSFWILQEKVGISFYF